MTDGGVEAMTDTQRLAFWMQSARRLRIIADLAEKLLILVGSAALAVGCYLLITGTHLPGGLAAVNGLVVAILGALLGAIGQNQASINECNCRMLMQTKQLTEHLAER